MHQTEQMVKDAKKKPVVKVHTRRELPQMHADAQSKMKDYLQSTVEIKRSLRGKGTLTIAFNSDADFERILSLLKIK